MSEDKTLLRRRRGLGRRVRSGLDASTIWSSSTGDAEFVERDTNPFARARARVGADQIFLAKDPAPVPSQPAYYGRVESSSSTAAQRPRSDRTRVRLGRPSRKARREPRKTDWRPNSSVNWEPVAFRVDPTFDLWTTTEVFQLHVHDQPPLRRVVLDQDSCCHHDEAEEATTERQREGIDKDAQKGTHGRRVRSGRETKGRARGDPFETPGTASQPVLVFLASSSKHNVGSRPGDALVPGIWLGERSKQTRPDGTRPTPSSIRLGNARVQQLSRPSSLPTLATLEALWSSTRPPAPQPARSQQVSSASSSPRRRTT